jgi:hypothetical protein
MMLAAEAVGSEITTVEGLHDAPVPTPTNQLFNTNGPHNDKLSAARIIAGLFFC